MEVSALKRKEESVRTAVHSAQVADVCFSHSGEHLWNKDCAEL